MFDSSKLGCWVNGLLEACMDSGNGYIIVSVKNSQVASRAGINIVFGDCFTNPYATKPIAYFSAKTYTP